MHDNIIENSFLSMVCSNQENNIFYEKLQNIRIHSTEFYYHLFIICFLFVVWFRSFQFCTLSYELLAENGETYRLTDKGIQASQSHRFERNLMNL